MYTILIHYSHIHKHIIMLTIHTSHTCTHYNRDRVEWDADQEKQAELAVKHNSSVFLANDKKGTRIMQ